MEFAGARAPEQGGDFRFLIWDLRFLIGQITKLAGEPVAERKRFPEMFGNAGSKRSIIQRGVGDQRCEPVDRIADIVFGRQFETLRVAQSREEAGPLLPCKQQRGYGPDAVQFREYELGITGARNMRIGVRHPGGQIVGFIDDEQGASRIEAGTVEEDPPGIGGKHVIVVANPDIVERQRCAGDFIRAQARVPSGGAERLQIVGLILEKIEPREPAVLPAGFKVREVWARIAHAVIDGVDAMLRLRSHLPRGDRRGDPAGHRGPEAGSGRCFFVSGGGAGLAHSGQRAHHLQLAGGFASQIEKTPEVAGTEQAECKFKQDARLAVTCGSLEEQDFRRVADIWRTGRRRVRPPARLRRDFAECGEQFILHRLLAGAQCAEGGTELQSSQPVASANLEIEELRQPFELRTK